MVDEDVFSAADTFAQFCKRTDWATVVGNRTSGDGLGGAPGIFLLENTGLLVMFCYDADENEDGTINAVNGTAPDYVCINQSPMDLCLQLIREGN